MEISKTLSFQSPPINEVIFGVEFASETFDSVHYGLFWETIKSEYPAVSSHLPLLTPEKANARNEDSPLMPRVWFETSDQKKLIQLQPDRFHFNWRKLASDDKYPNFATLLPEFLKVWKQFGNWAKSASVSITNVKFEISYINHIDQTANWNGPADNSKVVTFLDISGLGKHFSVLNSAANFHCQVENVGDLRIKTQQGVRKSDNNPVMIFELTVARSCQNETPEKWFSVAHDTILESFFALTNPKAHKLWGYVGGKA